MITCTCSSVLTAEFDPSHAVALEDVRSVPESGISLFGENRMKMLSLHADQSIGYIFHLY